MAHIKKKKNPIFFFPLKLLFLPDCLPGQSKQLTTTKKKKQLTTSFDHSSDSSPDAEVCFLLFHTA